MAMMVYAVQGCHEAAPETPGQVLLAPGQHGCVGLEAPRGEHLVVREVSSGAVCAQSLLGAVQRPDTVRQRGQGLPHAGHVFGIVAIEVTHRGEASVVPHQGEAAADVPSCESLVRRMMVSMWVWMVKFLRHGGYGGQVLQRRQRGIGAAQAHPGVTRHGHCRMQGARQSVVCAVVPCSLQYRGHAGHHG